MSDYLRAFLPIYLPITLGFLVRSTGYFPGSYARAINRFCLKVTIPLLVFTSMAGIDTELLSQVLPVTLSLPLYMLILWGIALGLSRLPFLANRRIESVLIIILGNIGYFGWPVLEIGLGREALIRGLMYATLYWPATIFFAFLTRIVIDRSRKGLAKGLQTLKIGIPILAAFAAGLIVALSGWSVPEILISPLSAFGNMTTSLILFGVGLSVSLRGSGRELIFLLPVRLFAGLAAAWITTRIVPGLDDLSRRSIMIVSTMSVGANTLIMGEVMGLDEEFLAGAVAFSAVLALATIPIILVIFT